MKHAVLRPNFSWNHLIRDILSCWMIASAAMMCMDPLFRFRLEAAELCVRALLLTTVFLCVGQRKWIWPAILGAGCLGAALFYGRELPAALTVLRGFIQWWIHQFPIDSVYNTAGWIALAQWLIHIFLCSLICLTVRLLRLKLVPAVLVLGFAGTVLTLGFAVSPAALPFGIVGFLILLTPPTDKGAGYARLLVGVLGAAACLLSSLCVPTRLPSWEGAPKPAGALVQDPLSLLGLQSDTGRLGGPLAQSANEAVLTVEGSDASLIRVGVYTQYYDSRWSVLETGQYAWNDGNLSYLPGASLPEERAQALTVTLLKESSLLPTVGVLQDLRFDERPDGLTFDRQQVLRCQKVLPPFRYTLYAALWDETGREAAIPDELETPYDYLAVTGVPSIVRQTAERVTAGCRTNRAKMEALLHYLKTEFTYTTSPSRVPEGEDLVAYFLKTGKGYCTYYASAMTLMLRSLRIPARFVCGYGLEQTGENEFTAYSSNAHAWTECYLEGEGWVTCDPTPAGYDFGVRFRSSQKTTLPTTMTTEATTTTTTTSASSQTAPSTGTESSAASTGTSRTAVSPTTASSASPGQAPGGMLSRIPSWVWYTAGAVLLLLVWLTWRVTVYIRAYTLEAVRHRCRTPREQLRWYFRDVCRQAALLGQPLKGDTLSDWKARAAGLSPQLAAAVTAAEDCLYGEREPSESEVELWCALRGELEQKLRHELPFPVYVWKRFVVL